MRKTTGGNERYRRSRIRYREKAYNTLEQEIPSATIGEMVMEGLKNLDQVAYIRFASVYRQFRDVTTFMQFIEQFEERLKNEK